VAAAAMRRAMSVATTHRPTITGLESTVTVI
jgi:hypothetical protein